MPEPVSTVRRRRRPASGTPSSGSRSVRPPRVPVAPKPPTIGARLNDALGESALTQTELARQLAGPFAAPTRVASVRRLIAKWRRDEHAPTLDYALRLAEIFEKPPNHFAPNATGGLEASERPSRSSTEVEAMEVVRQLAACVNEAKPGPSRLPRTRSDIAHVVPRFNASRILIDRVVELVPGERILAEKTFTDKDWGLGWWYKGTSLIPAVLLIEALSQAGALVLLTQPENRDRVALSVGFDNVRFRRVVMSGEKLQLECVISAVHGSIAHARVEGKVGSQVVVRGELVIAVN
jgi:3-hydroxyacyl-[acyl-carrier-protein] dehydratase